MSLELLILLAFVLWPDFATYLPGRLLRQEVMGMQSALLGRLEGPMSDRVQSARRHPCRCAGIETRLVLRLGLRSAPRSLAGVGATLLRQQIRNAL